MEGFLWWVGLGVLVYASTNLDNLVVLLAFFSDRSLRARHVVAGEYLANLLLIAVSAGCSVAARAFPAHWIGLLGLVPVVMGVKRLVRPASERPKRWRIPHGRVLA